MGMARKLQEGLAKHRIETLSIGISSFPMGDYSWRDSMLNACKALDHAAFFGPGAVVVFDAVSCNISGDKYYQNGRLDRAMAEYRAGLAMDSSSVNLLNSLGVCLAKCDEREKAKAAFETALQLDPNEAFAEYNLGVISVLNHEPDRALVHLKKSYASNRETFEIPFQIGKVLSDQGRHAQAKEYLETALGMRKDNAAVHRMLGECHAATGNHHEAMSAYRNAVKLNPNDATALSALGALYAATDENPDICMAFLEQSIAIDPENGLFRHRLARFFQERNQLRKALQTYEKAVDLGHDSSRQITELRDQIENDGDNRKRCSG
jgi:tetratricopeptide (TPR) repeat protein